VSMPEILLELKGLNIHYGRIQAVKGISAQILKGEITALVGANGAGKTTTLLGISGILKPSSGKIFFAGKDITHAKAHELVKMGIVHVPEGREILKTMSVMENLDLGAYNRKNPKEVEQDREWILSLFPLIKTRAKQLAGNLSGGEQQMLAIARALMARPQLMLLDEPSMGLAPLIVQEIFHILADINTSGITILLVEQNIRQALKISRHGYVLETGNMVLSGTGDELLNHPRLIEAYLGG